jgi:NADPH:quinone reductase-like Zn-dependent oxidoreductase
MRAIIIKKKGSSDSLSIEDVPVPDIKPFEVLVKVKAFGLNFADILCRLGLYANAPKIPFIPGFEISGIIEKVGSEVKDFSIGQRVFAGTRFKGYAEYVAVSERNVRLMPEGMTFEEGAGFIVTYLTAYHSIYTVAHLQKGEKILIHSAGGGVGTASIQIAKYIGAEIFATASSNEKLQVARKQGANHLINYSSEDFFEQIIKLTNGYGVDVVLDAVGGRVFKKSYKLLAPMGRYVLYGMSSVVSPRFNPFKIIKQLLEMPFLYPLNLISKDVSVSGFNLITLTHKIEYLNECIKHLLEMYKNGSIKPVIGKVFKFEEIYQAHKFMQSRESWGKLVVII